MIRTIVGVVALCLCVNLASAAQQPQQKQNQMVKGTIKVVDVAKGVLIVNQKLKDETVERQLDITPKTTFVITIGNEKKEINGKEGLSLLDGQVGASVAVKCDKDVNVLQVTAKIK